MRRCTHLHRGLSQSSLALCSALPFCGCCLLPTRFMNQTVECNVVRIDNFLLVICIVYRVIQLARDAINHRKGD